MARLLGVNHLDAVRALQKAGFWIKRQGKHIVMTDGTRIVTIPRNNPIDPIRVWLLFDDPSLVDRKGVASDNNRPQGWKD